MICTECMKNFHKLMSFETFTDNKKVIKRLCLNCMSVVLDEDQRLKLYKGFELSVKDIELMSIPIVVNIIEDKCDGSCTECKRSICTEMKTTIDTDKEYIVANNKKKLGNQYVVIFSDSSHEPILFETMIDAAKSIKTTYKDIEVGIVTIDAFIKKIKEMGG